jgi:hypothetical protein
MERLFRNESTRTIAVASRHAQGNPLPFAAAPDDHGANKRPRVPSPAALRGGRESQCRSHVLPAGHRRASAALSGTRCDRAREFRRRGRVHRGHVPGECVSDPIFRFRNRARHCLSGINDRGGQQRPARTESIANLRSEPTTGTYACAHPSGRRAACRAPRGFPAVFSNTRFRTTSVRRNSAGARAESGASSRQVAS